MKGWTFTYARVVVVVVAVSVAACGDGGRGGGGAGGDGGGSSGDLDAIMLADGFLAADEREERLQCYCECEGAPLEQCVAEGTASEEEAECFRSTFVGASQDALESLRCRLEAFRQYNDCNMEVGCSLSGMSDCEEAADMAEALCPWTEEAAAVLREASMCGE